ncbi:GATA zinc finger domain-containing protein 14-like [Octopus sinensis]|uniref:GATA zinc finger domain-containing protein 14-like n=1 Tax=Octopus sinensis TaxID=2607531 RepID=A0A6P7TI53_9MOLL|nr:GATA zinc finger domain-containing protein 14-like [Octopus sinensis]
MKWNLLLILFLTRFCCGASALNLTSSGQIARSFVQSLKEQIPSANISEPPKPQTGSLASRIVNSTRIGMRLSSELYAQLYRQLFQSQLQSQPVQPHGHGAVPETQSGLLATLIEKLTASSRAPNVTEQTSEVGEQPDVSHMNATQLANAMEAGSSSVRGGDAVNQTTPTLDHNNNNKNNNTNNVSTVFYNNKYDSNIFKDSNRTDNNCANNTNKNKNNINNNNNNNNISSNNCSSFNFSHLNCSDCSHQVLSNNNTRTSTNSSHFCYKVMQSFHTDKIENTPSSFNTSMQLPAKSSVLHLAYVATNISVNLNATNMWISLSVNEDRTWIIRLTQFYLLFDITSFLQPIISFENSTLLLLRFFSECRLNGGQITPCPEVDYKYNEIWTEFC